MWSDMLEKGNKPTAEEAAHLKANFENNCQKAAAALKEADVVIIFTGAGFSANSGLAVYGDVAKIPAYQARGLDYADICRPDWLEDDRELFYGFWGQCFNDYRRTQPHEGYEILKRWKDDKNGVSVVAEAIQARVARKVQLRRPFDDEIVERYTPYSVSIGGPAGAFFLVTSNVDAHSYDVFEAHELHECHGNIETWQCSDPYCSAGVWRAPLDHSFDVNTDSMLAPATRTNGRTPPSVPTQQATTTDNDVAAHIGQTKGVQRRSPLKNMPPSEPNNWYSTVASDEMSNNEPNWPQCGTCQSFARPAILMFGDFQWKNDIAQRERWDLWKEAVVDLCKKQANAEKLRVCIFEVGCGLNVPTCRMAAERLVNDVETSGGVVTLVRVNPDFPLTSDPEVKPSLVPIMSTGLATIKQVHKVYQAS
jgi:NAD-dependent SIR2 family protein deacetylase